MKVIYVRYTPCVRTIFAIDVFIQQEHFTFVFAWVKWCLTQIVLCLCFVFLRIVYPMLPLSLDFPFLLDPSVFFNVYLAENVELTM